MHHFCIRDGYAVFFYIIGFIISENGKISNRGSFYIFFDENAEGLWKLSNKWMAGDVADRTTLRAVGRGCG